MPETTLDVLALQLMQLDPADNAGVSEFVAGVRSFIAARGGTTGSPSLLNLSDTADLLDLVAAAQRGVLLADAGRYIEQAMGGDAAPAPEAPPVDSDTLPPDTDVDLLRDFIAESRDILTGAEAALLELESNPSDTEAVNTVFRAFHTIKGTAAFLGLSGLSHFAHHAESVLSLVRDKEIPYNSRCADLSLRSADMLKAFLDAVEAAIGGGRLVPPDGADVLTVELDGAAAGEIFEEALVETTSVEIDMTAVASVPYTGDPAADAQTAAENASAMMEAMASAVASVAAGVAREQPTGPVKAKHEAELSVRVRTDRLDRLIDMVGELVIAQSMIAGDSGVSQLKNQTLARKITHAGKIVRDLQDLSMSMRMVPLKGTFQKLTRLVRDLAQKSGKSVEFVTNGDDTEIDRNMVDAIADPLVHMVRNSLDHGLEPRDERSSHGKRPQGTLKLSAFHQGGHVVVELKDDGRGLNREKIIAKAIAKGLIESEKGMSDGDVWQLIFAPGFSTADKITDVSGRGVGMDVVRRNVEQIRGRIDVASEKGSGTTITLRLPLTLAITDGMLVRVGEERYIVPTINIQLSFRPTAESLYTVTGRGEMVLLRESAIPIVRLHRLFGIAGAAERADEALLMLVGDGERQCAVLVDELLGQYQVVAKSLGRGLGTVPGVSGGAILGDGRVGLILDVAQIIQLGRTAGNDEVTPVNDRRSVA